MNNPGAPPSLRLESLDNIDLAAMLNAADEFHSVDDFFNSYVAELTNRSKRAGGELSSDPIAKQLRTGPQPATYPMPSANGVLTGQDFTDLNRAQVSPSPFLGGASTAGIPPELLQQAALLGLQRYNATNVAAMGPIVQAPLDEPSPVVSGRGDGNFTADRISSPATVHSGEGHGPSNPPVQRHSGRGKSARQQEANKIAQQRYRERKKQKFQEMEKQVELLREELSKLQAVQARNQILEGMNNELQKHLVEREREVERLKVELDTHADASLGNGGISENSEGGEAMVRASGGSSIQVNNLAAAAAAFPNAPGAAAGGAVSCDILPRNLSEIDFEAGFASQINILKEFLAKHNLEELSTAQEDVPPDVIGELAQIVGTSCQLCQAAIRAEGARILEMIAGDPSQLSSAEHPHQDRFTAALDAMRMTPEQEEQLLLLRKSHLEKMREIYAERQSLNLEAMALMLPHHSRNPAEDNTLEGKMENISNFGYLPVAKSNAELASVLDSIKDNLRREQRSAMDINCATISKVLTPLQAAHYMVCVYPQHCDALALSNVLAQRLGKDGSVSAMEVNGNGMNVLCSDGCGVGSGSCK